MASGISALVRKALMSVTSRLINIDSQALASEI